MVAPHFFFLLGPRASPPVANLFPPAAANWPIQTFCRSLLMFWPILRTNFIFGRKPPPIRRACCSFLSVVSFLPPLLLLLPQKMRGCFLRGRRFLSANRSKVECLFLLSHPLPSTSPSRTHSLPPICLTGSFPVLPKHPHFSNHRLRSLSVRQRSFFFLIGFLTLAVWSFLFWGRRCPLAA